MPHRTRLAEAALLLRGLTSTSVDASAVARECRLQTLTLQPQRGISSSVTSLQEAWASRGAGHALLLPVCCLV